MKRMRPAAVLIAAAFTAACSGPPSTQDTVPAASAYANVARALETLIEHEMKDKNLTAISIALVDDQEIIWARGFGHARPDSTPATAATVHRVGSVSKLFTDIGIMQLVERGEVDLDVPVSQYIPDFQPNNTSGTPITLRHLMSHRSGLQREPAVGNYFADDEPTLAATVASLKGRDLVYKPGEKTKYSNAGIAVVGYVLEALKSKPFTAYLHEAVLTPIGTENSAFEPTPYVRDNLATAYMWTWDGRTYEAPTFQLGMAPAGSMYASVLDLGKFLSTLFAGGTGENGSVLRPETIEAMWTPQFAAPGARTGFGLGFSIGELEGHRRIGHGGAIYGFATDLAALPDQKLGAAVVITTDITNSVAERITGAALRLMLAAKAGQPLPEVRIPGAIPVAKVHALAGHYGNARRSIELVERNDQLQLRTPAIYHLRAFGDTLIVDDRAAFGTRLLPIGGNRVVIGTDTLVRRTAARPKAASAGWMGLIGEYGWDHNTLYIYEDRGRLHALIEWFFPYALTQESENVFVFPQSGLYDGEKLVFTRDRNGRATSVEAAGVVFERRNVGTEAGVTFRIEPVRPVEELRTAALAATPPEESGDFLEADLVELRSLDPTIRYDIRYASTNNFMSAAFYMDEKAFLQRPAAEAVARANQKLRSKGYGLLIHDAYRPWYVTKMFWDATPQAFRHFVADPAQGSRHNRGAAVDLTMFELATGKAVEMVGGYDEFSDRSYPDYAGGTSQQRWLRELLRSAMEAEGFEVYEWEWWHFDYGDWRRYRIGNQTFETITN
jgi:CubicO group peptidase (beta-lactamase class C family)/D-alanyl-D-alanine dipeptidase